MEAVAKALNMQNVGVGPPSDRMILRDQHFNEIGTEVFLEMATAAGVSCSDLNSDIVKKMVEDCKGFITSRLHPVLKGKVLECLII